MNVVLLSNPEFNKRQPSGDEFQRFPENSKILLFAQTKLNNLVRDLGVTKEKTELLGSRLENFLESETSIYIGWTNQTLDVDCK